MDPFCLEPTPTTNVSCLTRFEQLNTVTVFKATNNATEICQTEL